MKILYVSDLDETLLNSQREITPFSVDVINRYIAEGGLFTIATSCMAFECVERVASLHLSVPGVIMNGVCLYSFDTSTYHDVKVIEHSLIPEIEAAFSERGCNTLMYVYDHEKMSIFHTKAPSDADARYLSRRAFDSCREIRQVPGFSEVAKNHKVVCFAATGPPEQLTPVYEHIRKMADLETAFYPSNDLYCLEVYDHTASKANAVLKLKRKTHATELTVFGSSLNDIAMMEAADYCFAPRNAVDDARKIVNGLIENCDEDGLARFIKLRHGL
jgi:Cof subfamily protein (haloacid dehalogenase superfamily)